MSDAVEAALAFAERSPEATRTRTLTWQDPLASAAQAAGKSGLEYMRAIAAGEIPPPPIAVTLRMAPVEVEEGRVAFAGTPGEEHFNPIGTVHGGYVATLLDSAMGCAVHTTLPAGVGYTTLTLEVKFVRAIGLEVGRLDCAAEVVHAGRRQATAEGRVTGPDGRLYAHGTTTCMILRPEG
ncbi:MAG TPA: PaaI family thioesterase [Solirubrobacterales bacterium]